MTDPADSAPDADSYALRSKQSTESIAVPKLEYLPARATNYRPKIGLVGCGGISAEHLKAYRAAGYIVVALADCDLEKAKQRRDQFAPSADVYSNSADLIGRADIDIVDLAAHPREREKLIEDSLLANKHVLSQKPFVTDLEVGRRLCQLAKEKGCQLAVNQNGRWAPWVSWMRKAIENELIGDVASVDTIIAWDHSWVRGTPFERIPHLILYDFAIHWFDMLHCYTAGQRALRVYAQVQQAPGQSIAPPLLAQVMVQLEHCQATLSFRGNSPWGPINQTHITGSQGTLRSQGEGLDQQTVTLHRDQAECSPQLTGSWFPDGFDGAMSELIVAIEEGRPPANSGDDNLAVLEICFAAIQSAESDSPVTVGDVQRVEPKFL